jgi:NADPH:quinone reductase
MRAAVCRDYGPPEVVKVEDVPSLAVGPDQVRVRVDAAAVNFPDVLLVANKYQISVSPPFVPGSEFAGVVAEVGDEVDDLVVGDRVFGSTFVGAFATDVVVGATALRPVPDGVSARHAAAFGVAHGTAYHLLRSVAAVQPGEELVVLGAGGGVGLAVVQLGVSLGATVTAIASSAEKLDVARANGATRAIDHRSTELRPALRELLPSGADVVVDPVGGSLAEAALRSLRWGGRFVTVGYASGEIPRIPLNVVLLKGVRVLGFELRGFVTHAPDEFQRNTEELTELLATGRVVPHIGATFGLDGTAAALRHVADGQAIGKVVIDVGAG